MYPVLFSILFVSYLGSLQIGAHHWAMTTLFYAMLAFVCWVPFYLFERFLGRH